MIDPRPVFDDRDSDGDESPGDRVLAEMLEQLDRGELVDREALLDGRPELSDELRDYFETAYVVERMAGPVLDEAHRTAILSPVTGHRPDVEETQAVAVPLDELPGSTLPIAPGEAPPGRFNDRGAGPADADPQSAWHQFPRRFGRYRIERCLGRGAMGAVYLAQDTSLVRPVALKVPQFSAGAGLELVERFYREARAAATLGHRNICPVYDVGSIEGVPYLTMAFLEGRTLKEYIHPEQLQPQRQIAAAVRKLALAIDHAHARGIIHRDLKPANIMVDRDGEPVVMDFGLARRFDGLVEEKQLLLPATERLARDPSAAQAEHSDLSRFAHLTETGLLVGTPAYMSPEQLDGRPQAVGPASDQYSLGVIFYELLTGRLPYTGSLASVMSQIVAGDPSRPSHCRSDLDERLETVCLRMMSTRPGDRYDSLAAVSQDLHLYLRSTPDQGHTTTQIAVAPDDSRSNEPRTVAAPPRGIRAWLALPVLLAVAAGAVGAGGWLLFRVTPDDDAKILSTDAQSKRDANTPGRPGSATQPETAARAPENQREAVMAAVSDLQILRIDAPDQLLGLAVAGNDQWALTPCADGHVYVWDLKTGGLRHKLSEANRPAVFAAISDDGSHAAAAHADGSIDVWNAVTGALINTFSAGRRVTAVALSTNGRNLAVATTGWPFHNREIARVYATRAGDVERRIDTFTPVSVAGAAISADGRRLAVASLSGTVEVARLDSGATSSLRGGLGPSSGLALSRDGRYLAIANAGSTTVYDLNDGGRISLNGAATGGAVALSIDGRLMLAATDEAAAELWMLPATTASHDGEIPRIGRMPLDFPAGYGPRSTRSNRRVIARFDGHDGRVTGVALLPSRQAVVTCSEDKSLRVWKLPAGVELHSQTDAAGAGERVPVYHGDNG